MVIHIELDKLEYCDDPCSGSKANLADLKEQMIDGPTITALSDLFKALSDPTRLRIIYALMHNELCVHDLTLILDMGQSAVSHQLRVLRNLRIVKRRKEGKTVFYSLDDDHIEQIVSQTLHHIKHD